MTLKILFDESEESSSVSKEKLRRLLLIGDVLPDWGRLLLALVVDVLPDWGQLLSLLVDVLPDWGKLLSLLVVDVLPDWGQVAVVGVVVVDSKRFLGNSFPKKKNPKIFYLEMLEIYYCIYMFQ